MTLQYTRQTQGFPHTFKDPLKNWGPMVIDKWFVILVIGFTLLGWFFPVAFGLLLVAIPFFVAGVAIGMRLFL